jgi:hypothetical protein
MHALGVDERRQILEHRIAPRHHAPERLRALAAEYAEIMRRRDVATHGILFKPHGGPYEFRSFSATRTISDGEVDTLTIDELVEWSQRAVRATEQFVSLAEPRGRAVEAPAA